MKISFITTVLNEEKTIEKLLKSLAKQTKKPEEIIIVDAGSKDKTVVKIKNLKLKMKNSCLLGRQGKCKIKIFVLPGANRSQGRNLAIKKAKNEIIAVSDAGCALDPKWLEEISKPFKNPKIEVVAGYYQPVAKTIFQKCLACYTCVMPDRVQPCQFLPSSRSLAFRKSSWQKAGGYPEELDYCEDLVFAQKLKKAGCQFKFAPQALVFWCQRKNFLQAFKQFFHYASGDAQALYWPHLKKALLVFSRYLSGMLMLFLSTTEVVLSLLLIYGLWAIKKNYRYLNHPAAFFYLPLLQITADLAVMAGTLRGLIKKI